MSLPQTRLLDRASPPHLVTLVAMAAVAALSMNAFLPSLPGMAKHYGVDYAVMQLSVSLYLFASAALHLLIGPLSDRFGRRKVALWGLGLFCLASLAAILAPTAEMFLLARMAQAVVAVGLVISRAIVRDVADEAEAASLLGYITMFMALVPMVGPVLGGILDELFGWQANFALLLSAGLAVWLLVWLDCGETNRQMMTSVMVQFRALPELLRSPRFWGYVLSAAFASGVFFAFLGGAPFVASQIYGLGPSAMGAYFAPTALGYAFGNFLSGRYSRRFGANRLILAGTLLTSAGLLALAFLLALGLAPAPVFFAMFAFVGIGNGLVLPGAMAGSMSVRPHLAGSAAGIGSTTMIGGGAVLAALAGALLSTETGAWPLLAVTLASSFGSFVAIVFVIRRARALGIS